MAAVVTPPRITPGPRRPQLRLVSPEERADAGEPLFSVQAVLAVVAIALVLMVGVLAIGRGAFAGLAPDAPSGAGSAAVVEAGQTVVVVRHGDTLWSIARDLEPTGDIRPLVDRLAAAHGSSSIVPGDRIAFDR